MDHTQQLEEMGQKAVRAKYIMQTLSTEKKDKALTMIADAFLTRADEILTANEKDIRADPVGEELERFERPNGLRINKVRVPLGVIGIIYESRPNVTADAFGLCFKTGNAVILKGGSDALHSNIAVSKIIRDTLSEAGITQDAIQLIADTDRQVTKEFMKMSGYVDVLIPRGGAGLIRTVVENSTIPVIETGTGNCHIYIDEDADINKAIPIIDRIRDCIDAAEQDYGTEYLDYILSMKTVDSIEEAIGHINRYSTGHSDAIMTENKEHAALFLAQIDSACVYVNASTRFTDGFEFGFGAEIGKRL